jgi:chromosome segregation ATPase
MAELKPRSVRMSDENYTRLQGLSEGRSLDETITQLLSTHDKDEERNGLGAQAIKLDELDEFLNAIRSQYAALLHSCQNAKEIVRTEYKKELEEKNAAIEGLKDDLLKSQKTQIKKETQIQETVERLRSQLEEEQQKTSLLEEKIKDYEQSAREKQQITDSLSVALTAAEKKSAELEPLKKELSQTKAQLTETQILYKKSGKELEETKNNLKKAKESCQAQMNVLQETHIQEQKEDKEKLTSCQKEYEEKLQQQKSHYEQELSTLRATCDLSVREAAIQAQAQINEIKEEYQTKLFDIMVSKEK